MRRRRSDQQGTALSTSRGLRQRVDAAQLLPLFLGGDLTTTRRQHVRASPLHRVTPNAAPTLCIHGTADRYVAHDQAEWLVDRLNAAGVGAELLTLEGVGHGFKGKDAEAALVAFFDRYLKRKRPALARRRCAWDAGSRQCDAFGRRDKPDPVSNNSAPPGTPAAHRARHRVRRQVPTASGDMAPTFQVGAKLAVESAERCERSAAQRTTQSACFTLRFVAPIRYVLQRPLLLVYCSESSGRHELTVLCTVFRTCFRKAGVQGSNP
jgi:Prolyl oligopeptidase family